MCFLCHTHFFVWRDGKRNPHRRRMPGASRKAATDEDADADQEGWDGLFLEEDDNILESDADMDNF